MEREVGKGLSTTDLSQCLEMDGEGLASGRVEEGIAGREKNTSGS